MYVHNVHVVPVDTRSGHKMLGCWSHRWLLATKWVLGIEPMSSGRVLQTAKPSLQPYPIIIILCMHVYDVCEVVLMYGVCAEARGQLCEVDYHFRGLQELSSSLRQVLYPVNHLNSFSALFAIMKRQLCLW